MTVREVLTAVKSVKPSQYDDRTLTRWLAALDARIYEDVIGTHEGHGEPPPPPDFLFADQERRLLVPSPHDDLYLKWLGAQIDYHNAEFDRYNNGMVMFNAGLQAFADSYNRANRPKQDHWVTL